MMNEVKVGTRVQFKKGNGPFGPITGQHPWVGIVRKVTGKRVIRATVLWNDVSYQNVLIESLKVI